MRMGPGWLSFHMYTAYILCLTVTVTICRETPSPTDLAMLSQLNNAKEITADVQKRTDGKTVLIKQT